MSANSPVSGNKQQQPSFGATEWTVIILLVLLVIWGVFIQPAIDNNRREMERLTEEAQDARQIIENSPYCYKMFYENYAEYLDGGMVSFDFACDGEEDLWDFFGWWGEASYYRFNGTYSEYGDLFLITIDQESHVLLISDDPVIGIEPKDGENRYLVLGNSFSFEYEAGFEPKPEPEESYIWVDVPNARYNSAGCIAYRMLGGSSGLGGENPMNPNYDPECAYPTHQEKKYIENP